jgi:ABC-type proline/glycine betaine transport system ATPase subunit
MSIEENMGWISKAIRHLDSIAEYKITEDDLESIEWIVTSNGPISINDIEQNIPLVKQLEADKQAQAQAAKAALLDRLGITEDEAKLLLS